MRDGLCAFLLPSVIAECVQHGDGKMVGLGLALGSSTEVRRERTEMCVWME